MMAAALRRALLCKAVSIRVASTGLYYFVLVKNGILSFLRRMEMLGSRNNHLLFCIWRKMTSNYALDGRKDRKDALPSSR
jgi:hypothetical protein